MWAKTSERNTRETSRHIWYATAIAIILLGAGVVFLENIDSQRFQQIERVAVLRQLSTVRARLEGVINGNLQSVTGLITEVSFHPEISQKEFSRYARAILARNNEIRNIAAARDMVITHMSPMQGNEKAIGLDYRTNKKQAAAALKAKEIGGIFVAGPVNLVQGGRGFIARMPIYESAPNGDQTRGKFWGLISTVIDVDKLYTAAGLTDPGLTIAIAMRGQDSRGADGEIIFGHLELFDDGPVLMEVSLPHGSWQLAATPKDGWAHVGPNATVIRVAGGVMLIMIIGLMFYRQRQSQEKARVEKALQESEERFRAFASYSPNKLHIKDTEGRFLLINRKSEELFGLTNEQAKGKTSDEVFTAERSEAFKAHDKAVLETGKSIEKEEDFHLDDGVHTYLTVKFPILGAGGEIIAVGSSGFDITKRKQTQAQLIQSAKLATLGEMATGIAHELSQPLNIIQMAAEYLQETNNEQSSDSKVLARKYATILSQTARASGIIDHMRIFGRMDSDELENIDITAAVQGAIGLIGEQMRLSEIELSINIPEACAKVIGRQLPLEQVILNLLTNGRDAISESERSDKTPRWISIKVADDPDAQEVKLTIEDSGGGIPKQVIDRIFEPFFTTKEVGKGTGLGLSISYGIITEMGGQLEAANIEGGARFTLTLPTHGATNGERATRG